MLPGVTGPSRFHVNHDGIRGPEIAAATGSRLLAIGGSTTECIYLDQGRTWPAQLARRLTEQGEDQIVWVGNAGRSGHYSGDNVLQVYHLTRELSNIDMVLVLAGINDLQRALAQTYGNPPVDPQHVVSAQLDRAFADYPGRLRATTWYKRMALFRTLVPPPPPTTDALLFEQNDTGTVYQDWRASRAAAPTLATLPDLKPVLEVYRANLETIVDIAASRGVQVVLMTQPALWHDEMTPAEERLLWFGWAGTRGLPQTPYYSVDALRRGLELFNTETRDVCAARRIPCVDLAVHVGPSLANFYDDVHFNDGGAVRVAREVATVIARFIAPRSGKIRMDMRSASRNRQNRNSGSNARR